VGRGPLDGQEGALVRRTELLCVSTEEKASSQGKLGTQLLKVERTRKKSGQTTRGNDTKKKIGREANRTGGEDQKLKEVNKPPPDPSRNGFFGRGRKSPHPIQGGKEKSE